MKEKNENSDKKENKLARVRKEMWIIQKVGFYRNKTGNTEGSGCMASGRVYSRGRGVICVRNTSNEFCSGNQRERKTNKRGRRKDKMRL